MNLLEPNDNIVAERARSSASYYYNENNFSNAFANFLLALNIRNDWHDDLKAAFVHSLCEWGKLLEDEGRFSELFTCYEEALKIFPRSEVILNNLGAHLLRLNHYKEASRYFRESLSINSLYLPAYRNLQNVSNLLLERWHFRMLNDQNRNECYRRAILGNITQGRSTVLDIGTGTGLLSLFAAEKYPKNIYACDYSEVMTAIAMDIMDKNGLSNEVAVINKLSNDLEIPGDIPDKVSLLVTEIMDAGLLGEGLLETLDDAWNRLIKTQESKENCQQRVIPQSATMYIAPLQSVYLARKYKHVCNNFIRSGTSGFDLMAKLDEPYDTEDLKSIEYKFLSDPVNMLNFDFNDPCQIKDYLECEQNTQVNIECNGTGKLDAFAVWFDLHLNENEQISTSPLSEIQSCWEQAIFPVNKNLDVFDGTEIQLNISTKDGKLVITNYSVNSSLKRNPANAFLVSQDLISFLNSESTIDHLNNISNELIRRNVPISKTLDLSLFPYIGLKMLEYKKGNIVSFQSEETDILFLKSYAQMRNFEEDSYDFFSSVNLCEYLKGSPEFDLVIIDLFDRHGELNESWMTLYPLVRKCVKDNGSIFPTQVKIHCQLVYSKWLDSSSKLNNTFLLDKYKGFDAVNDFKVNQFVDLNINQLKFNNMSQSLEIAQLKIDRIFTDSLAEFNASTKAVEDGWINAVLYWYSYGNDTVMISSRADDHFRNQAAEVLTNPIYVKKCDCVSVQLSYMSCILKFDVSKSTNAI